MSIIALILLVVALVLLFGGAGVRSRRDPLLLLAVAMLAVFIVMLADSGWRWR